jgi:hypothetical protein
MNLLLLTIFILFYFFSAAWLTLDVQQGVVVSGILFIIGIRNSSETVLSCLLKTIDGIRKSNLVK